METGIKRDVVGDIIVTDDGCQAVVSAEIVDYLLTIGIRWARILSQLEVIDEEQLAVEPERIKEIRSTVASRGSMLWLQQVMAHPGLRWPGRLKAERLKVNWKVISDPAHPEEEGDILSLRGRGRLVVQERSTCKPEAESISCCTAIIRRYEQCSNHWIS